MPAGTITRIATIQRSLRELGRIRLGQQVEYQKNGRTMHRPEKLKTFRLTSASRAYVDAAAEAYGGTVREWDSPRGREYEIVIESPTLDVLVPPGDAVAQAFEMWTAAGCIRRCDGIRQETGAACACPSEASERTALAAKSPPEACKPTTRLWVILPLLPDLGRWRLEAHGYYAAVELAGMAEIASMATSRGIMLPARLRIDQRRRKIPGQGTRDYIVPVLELPETNFGQLVASGHIPTTNAQLDTGIAPARAQLGSGQPARVGRPALGPAPTLPSEAQFERAATPTFGAAPEIVAGGWQIDPTSTADTPGAPSSDGSERSASAQPATVAAPSAAVAGAPALCGDEDASPMALGICAKPKGHSGVHASKDGTWPR